MQTLMFEFCRVDSVDFVKESKQLLEYITKLQLNQPVMPPQPAAGGGGGSGYGGARTPGAPLGAPAQMARRVGTSVKDQYFYGRLRL